MMIWVPHYNVGLPFCLQDTLFLTRSPSQYLAEKKESLYRHEQCTLCCSRKYPYPSHGRFFLNWTPHLSRNSILVSYFHSKNWDSETPLPFGISVNLPWGQHGYFLELHIMYFQHINCINSRKLVYHSFQIQESYLHNSKYDVTVLLLSNQ